MELDTLLLRTGSNLKIAEHLLDLIKAHPVVKVCNTLLDAVDAEAVDSRILTVFLTAAKSTRCMKICLEQEVSTRIRHQAIKFFGRALRHPERWEEAWTAMGGTQGVLDYLSRASVIEGRDMFKKIGMCNRGEERPQGRSQAIEELLKAYSTSTYPESEFESTDKRPNPRNLWFLIQGCSNEFVEDLLNNGLESNNSLYYWLADNRLEVSHPALVRDYAFRCTFRKMPSQAEGHLYQLQRHFCLVGPSQQGDREKFSASMTFSEDLLRRRLDDMNSEWTCIMSEFRIWHSLYKRCIRNRVGKGKMHEIMALGLAIPKDKVEWEKNAAQDFWQHLCKLWLKNPNQWQDLLFRGMRAGLAGKQATIGQDTLDFMDKSNVENDKLWDIFRLYCLYVPEKGIDIDRTTDLSIFAKQKWPHDIFTRLPTDKGIWLMKNLMKVNPSQGFIDSTTAGYTIYQSHTSGTPRNFDVLLLLTQLQAQSKIEDDRTEARTRSEAAIENWKTKSTAARDPSERAEFAKAATYFAIASGSLQMYGETIQWLGRFVRDAVTVKVVFSKEVACTVEGIALLSGIPNDDLKDCQLRSISNDIARGNEIFLTLYAHSRLARREPSYQKSDWRSVPHLIETVLAERIKRAEKLQTVLGATDGDLYSAIWSQFFALLSQIGTVSLTAVHYKVQSLMKSLPPKTLATTTRALLETGNKYRADKSKSGESEDESGIVDSLTFACLLSLAQGDKPELAKDLIIETIISRPEASSWHRQILKRKYLNSLPAKEAEAVLLSFATAIGEKLEEQSYVKIGDAGVAPSLVKVTTVKYLAQLLSATESISVEASVNVLIELFKSGTHSDIRLETLDSLLGHLRSLADKLPEGDITSEGEIQDPLILRITTVLKTIIPIVGSVNERRVPREQDWAEAEKDHDKLPKVFDSGSPPLWHMLLESVLDERYSGAHRLKRVLVDTILLPILEHSYLDHKKWLGLFLKKHCAEFGIDELPAVPVHLEMLTGLMSSLPELSPKHYLQTLDAHTQFMLNPPPQVETFIRRRKQDEESAENTDPHTQHFLQIFAADKRFGPSHTIYPIIELIHHCWKPSILGDDSGITLEACQAVILRYATAFLKHYDHHANDWDTLMLEFRHPTTSKDAYAAWRTDCRPVLASIIDAVEGTRTRKWRADINRTPSVLPSTMKYRFWMAEYPVLLDFETDAEEVRRICEQLGDVIVDAIIAAQPMTRRASTFIKDCGCISEKLDDAEKMLVALRLGALPRGKDDAPAVQVLRVLAAMEFIEQGRSAFSARADGKRGGDYIKTETRVALRGRARDMLESWRLAAAEEVRELVVDWRAEQTATTKWGDTTLWDDIFAVEGKE